MLSRRVALRLLAGALGGVLTPACTRGPGPSGYRGGRIASDPAGIPERLARLEATLLEMGFPHEELAPGMDPEEIRRRTAGLGFPFPDELVHLYAWRDGSPEGGELFLFRDHVMTSVAAGIENLRWTAGTYGVEDAFPFAAFEGSFLVLPSSPYAIEPLLERPVVSVFEGVDVHYLSFTHLLDTVIEWLERGAHAPGGRVDPDLEMEIWRANNPGLFG